MKPILVVICGSKEEAELKKRMHDLYPIMMQRPFPNGDVITNMLTRAFPELRSTEIYKITQHVKAAIQELEKLASLATIGREMQIKPRN